VPFCLGYNKSWNKAKLGIKVKLGIKAKLGILFVIVITSIKNMQSAISIFSCKYNILKNKINK
jgi:hypothetical protein